MKKVGLSCHQVVTNAGTIFCSGLWLMPVPAVIAMPYLLLLTLMLSGHAVAGIYGSENWGEMYWGDNPVTAPTDAPTITSVVATEGQITITLSDFPLGTGADGWSAVTSYTVTCGETSVETSDTSVTITGLDSDTEYSCSVSASNALGSSPTTVKVVMTDAMLQGLKLFLICSAIECKGVTS